MGMTVAFKRKSTDRFAEVCRGHGLVVGPLRLSSVPTRVMSPTTAGQAWMKDRRTCRAPLSES